jgi:hypothetical protein
MLLLGLNDHVWKAAYPGVVTGKLSDLAGLAFFPLLLQAAWEVARRRVSSRRALMVAAVVTGLVFTLVKTWPVATRAWAWALAVLQAPVRGGVFPGGAVTDPTDLVALPTLGLAVWAGWRRAR